jgi:putative ABC transport system permease protein
MSTLTNIAINNNRRNKTRSILIIISVFLTTLLLTVILTWGYGIVKSNRVNAVNLYGSYYGVFRGLSYEQTEDMRLRNEFAEIGLMSYAGVIENKDKLSLFFADETARNLTNMDRQLEEGTYPLQETDITAKPEFFRKLGITEPRVGEVIQVSFRPDLNSKYEKKNFRISGLMKESNTDINNSTMTAFISQVFFEAAISKSNRQFHAYFALNKSMKLNYDTAKAKIEELGAEYGLKEEYIMPNVYFLIAALDPGTETIWGVTFLGFIVILFSIVVIYNIYQVGLVQKLQEYGKLKALGATKKQLKEIVIREGMLLGAIGVPLGLGFGYFVSVIFFDLLMKQGNAVRGDVEMTKVSIFSLPLLLLVAILALTTVWLALRKPIRTVSVLSPIEAIVYQESKGKDKGLRKGRSSIHLIGITLAGLKGSLKNNISTICTMGLSCVLFVGIAGLAGNINDEYNARKEVEYGRFYLSLDYSLNDKAYPENNLDRILKNNPLNSELIERIKAIPGVTEVKVRKLLAVHKEKGNSEEESLADVMVLNKEDFTRFSKYSTTTGDFNYDKASSENLIYYGWANFMEDYGYYVGQDISMEIAAGSSGEKIGRHIFHLAGSFSNMDTDWVITEDTYEKLKVSGETNGYLWIDCDKKAEGNVKEELEKLLENTDKITLTSYAKELKASQIATEMIKFMAYTFLGVMGLIGFLNMANTIITRIITRRQELGILQAVGMTNRQLNKMLQMEGLLFTAGTVFIALAVGTPAGYLLFRYGKENSWFGLYEYHFPVMEMGLMVAAIAVLQITLSYLLSRNLKKASLVERIRYQE